MKNAKIQRLLTEFNFLDTNNLDAEQLGVVRRLTNSKALDAAYCSKSIEGVFQGTHKNTSILHAAVAQARKNLKYYNDVMAELDSLIDSDDFLDYRIL